MRIVGWREDFVFCFFFVRLYAMCKLIIEYLLEMDPVLVVIFAFFFFLKLANMNLKFKFENLSLSV